MQQLARRCSLHSMVSRRNQTVPLKRSPSSPPLSGLTLICVCCPASARQQQEESDKCGSTQEGSRMQQRVAGRVLQPDVCGWRLVKAGRGGDQANHTACRPLAGQHGFVAAPRGSTQQCDTLQAPCLTGGAAGARSLGAAAPAGQSSCGAACAASWAAARACRVGAVVQAQGQGVQTRYQAVQSTRLSVCLLRPKHQQAAAQWDWCG